MLNGRLLEHHEGISGPVEFEVTSMLSERNELNVEVEFKEGQDRFFGEVALEIRAPAFLRNVNACFADTEDAKCLHVTGQVFGSSDQPLELYAILDRKTVAYSKLGSNESGTSFLLISDVLEFEDAGKQKAQSADATRVRVELVQGSNVWYGVDVPLAIEGDGK
jgi:hypothetical protein